MSNIIPIGPVVLKCLGCGFERIAAKKPFAARTGKAKCPHCGTVTHHGVKERVGKAPLPPAQEVREMFARFDSAPHHDSFPVHRRD